MILTLNGRAVRLNDTVYSPFHGAGKVVDFDYRNTTHKFEVLFLREHWNINFSHIYVKYPTETEYLSWEPIKEPS